MATLSTFVNDITNFIGTAVANLFLTLAVVVFFWSVINFMMKRAQGASDGMKQARDMLGWSIVGLFVMFSIWGIVYFFQNAFQITNQNSISAPSIKVNTTNGTAGSATPRNSNTNTDTATTPNYGNDGARQIRQVNRPNGSTCSLNTDCASGRCESGRSSISYCVSAI